VPAVVHELPMLSEMAAHTPHAHIVIRDRAPEACFKAFLNNNGFGLVIFCGLLLDFLPAASL